MHNRARQGWLNVFLAAALGTAVGCSSLPVNEVVPAPDSALIAAALTGSPLALEQTVVVTENPDTLLSLTPAMAHFAEQSVRGYAKDAARTQALHRALIDPPEAGGLGMRYHAAATLTPQQVFVRREANCLSFSLLFVAMARHVGLRASVNDVSIPPAWDMTGDRVQFMRHVNAKVDLRFSTDAIVVDLDLPNYRPYYAQRLISDATAKSQYYNNRAMADKARAATLAERFYNLKQALALDDSQSFLWNNLASLYWRAGHLSIAEALYLKALETNPRDLTAIWNLSELSRQLGKPDTADELAELASDYRDANPYYQYRLASRYFLQADYAEAATSIESAIKMQPNEKRFYQLAADIYETMGLEAKQSRALSHL